MKYLAWLWRGTAGVRCNMIARVLLGVARVALGLYVVWLSKQFIDVTIKEGSDSDVIRMAVMLLVAVFGGVILRQITSYMSVHANIRKINEIRLSLFGDLFGRKLFGEKVLLSGDVTSRMSKDVEQVCDVITEDIPQIIVTMAQLVGAFLMMRWFDPRLAWALVIMTAVFSVVGKFVIRVLRNMTKEIRKEESSIQMRVQEAVEFNAVLRSLGSEGWLQSGLNTMQGRLKKLVMRRTRFTVIARVFVGTAFGLGYMLAFVWGGIGLRNGVITFGVMTSFLQLVMQIQHPILTLLNMAPQIIHATASIDRLEELRSDSGSAEKDKEPLEQSASMQSVSSDQEPFEGVSLKDVSFSYAGGDHVVLDQFSYDFKPGSKTAIMGETGAGKTTLFRLMLGLVEPSSGTIRVDSSRLAFVPQGNSLLSGNIRYNLQVANPFATEEDMLAALHTACADFVKDLPQGLDTELGERGVGLSEGQAQRVAIARGLLHKGSILLLDEISSSLDDATEQELYRRLFAAYPQKTMIFITHRKAVCELCDGIIKM